MSCRGFICALGTGELVPSQECVACAAAIEPPRGRRCQYIASTLSALAARHFPAYPYRGGLSVTQLTGCLRKSYLDRTVDYYEEPVKGLAALHGVGVHALHEQAVPGREGIEREVKAQRTLRLAGDDGAEVTISGRIDELDRARCLITDLKTVGHIPERPQPDHIAQVNVYRWLLAGQAEIAQLGIVYMTRSEVRKCLAPVWTFEETEVWLIARATPLHRALTAGVGAEWPQRQYREPERMTFCRNYCAHLTACVERGETP